MKLFVPIGLVAAIAVALTVPYAFGSGTGSQTLEFMSVQQRFSTVPPVSHTAPPTVGVRFVFQDRAYNRGPAFGKPAGAAIGHAEGVCTLIAVSKVTQAQCLITAHVPNGQIVAAGEGDPGAPSSRYAVIGGLGAYTNAHGWITTKAVSDTKTLVTIHLAD